jgi:hypothetical protein
VALAAAVLLLFLLAGAQALIPGARRAVADLLGVPGIRIVIERETPTPIGSPVGSSLLLGQRTTLDAARAAVPFALRLPDPATYGQPDEVYLRTLPDGNPMVTFLYYPAPNLPRAAETGAGSLLMAFPSPLNGAAFLAKGVAVQGGDMIRANVNGADGWWITGASNLMLIEDPSAPPFGAGPSRPSANVLLWSEGGVTYRLESDLDETAAVAMAESLTPASGDDAAVRPIGIWEHRALRAAAAGTAEGPAR